MVLDASPNRGSWIKTIQILMGPIMPSDGLLPRGILVPGLIRCQPSRAGLQVGTKT